MRKQNFNLISPKLCLTCDNVTMNKEVHFLMSQTQLNRFAVILGISERQIIRLKQGVIATGKEPRKSLAFWVPL